MLRQNVTLRISRAAVGTLAAAALLIGCITSPSALLGDTDEPGPTRSEVEASKTNTPPIAVAGEDATVDAGALVVLNGTASSDPDGQRLSYIWQQVDGEPLVELKGPFSSFARFDAPADLDAETTLTFRLLVIDGFAFAADEVTVTVQPAP